MHCGIASNSNDNEPYSLKVMALKVFKFDRFGMLLGCIQNYSHQISTFWNSNYKLTFHLQWPWRQVQSTYIIGIIPVKFQPNWNILKIWLQLHLWSHMTLEVTEIYKECAKDHPSKVQVYNPRK